VLCRPHRDKNEDRDRHAQRLRLVHPLQRLNERHASIKPEDVAQLHQEQQYRRGVLETGHHRMRRELDQRTEPDQPKQQLEQATEQDDGKNDGEGQRQPAGLHDRCVGMNEPIEQDSEKEGRRDARRVQGRRLLAECDAGDADHHRRGQAGQRAGREVFIAERDEGEHAEAHRERDRHARGDESPDEVAADAGAVGVRYHIDRAL
jgi:hypothetical protein